ncbi:unnamed protein product [Peniophora sp. CBMAI 1063]|nr:unnamed protein product [Peniophora sp. CBMAI 1063]
MLFALPAAPAVLTSQYVLKVRKNPSGRKARVYRLPVAMNSIIAVPVLIPSLRLTCGFSFSNTYRYGLPALFQLVRDNDAGMAY